MSSLSRATVFRVENLSKHENANSLMVGEFEGCPFIVNMNDTHNGDLRVFVPFDMICPDQLWVGEFVRGKRVRPIRLRGVFSMAVCLPLPEGYEATEGDDVTESLGFTKWEPEFQEERDGVELQSTGNGRECAAPSGLSLGKYDLENLRKYHKEFVEDEMVVITEKMEGENISIVYWDGGLHVKSRNRWIADGDNKWWQTVRLYDWKWLEENPGLVVIGEKYGNVNNFRYDCVTGEQKIRLFDAYDANKGKFLNYEDFYELPFDVNNYVPLIYIGKWQGLDHCKELAKGNTTIKPNQNLMEGIVVQPFTERQTSRFERVKYKLHSETYLIAKGKA
jgi:RNA ligase (TIGR02306 family)